MMVVGEIKVVGEGDNMKGERITMDANGLLGEQLANTLYA